MKFFRLIRRAACLAAALLLGASVCLAGETFTAEDTGLDLTAELSVHYPTLTGGADEALLKQVNEMIRQECRVGEYFDRAAQLMVSGGSLRTEWKGSVAGDVFCCAVSALGAVENSRTTHVWTACAADLRDGHRITFGELFTDEDAARQLIADYLEDEVMPELSAHLANSELTPLPETFLPESSGLTLLYPVSQLSTLSDRAGDIRISWHILRDVLDPGDDSIPTRIGAWDMITLSAENAEILRAEAAEGALAGIPMKLGDSVQELTDRYGLLTDPDGFEGGRLFSLEGGCFRGTFLMTDDLTRDWKDSVVQGIRMDQGCLHGLCIGVTAREEWLSALGAPDGTTKIDDEKAEANRIGTGACDYYDCGEHTLRLYSDEDGILAGIVLAE